MMVHRRLVVANTVIMATNSCACPAAGTKIWLSAVLYNINTIYINGHNNQKYV